MKKKTLMLKKNFWSQPISTNFDLTQNYDFILTYKIHQSKEPKANVDICLMIK